MSNGMNIAVSRRKHQELMDASWNGFNNCNAGPPAYRLITTGNPNQIPAEPLSRYANAPPAY